MAVTEIAVSLDEPSYAGIQDQIREQGLDGWLLYDFRGTNPIATGILGLPALSRRFMGPRAERPARRRQS